MRSKIIKLLIMLFSPLSYYIVQLRTKYFLQHPILKHPQILFILQHDRQRFTPAKNSRKNYRSANFNIFISFRYSHNAFLHDIQGVSGGIVNILGGGSIDYSEQISSYKHVSNFQFVCEDTAV